MGTHKLSLPIRDRTIGSLSLYAAVTSELDHIFAITRGDDTLDWIDWVLRMKALKNRWTVVRCCEAEKGQSFSLKAGLSRAKEEKADGVVVLLADQPFIRAEMINELIFQYEQYVSNHKKLDFVAAMFGNLLRPPVLLSKNLFLKLITLTGDAGAQGIIRQNPDLNGISIIYEDRKAFLILIQRKITNWREKEGYKNEHEDTGCKSLDSNRH
ncbi:enzyme for molybdopterin cofactor synthesis required for xanthine dehydrogenase [Geobacillus sp. GHH01]|nr:enzyme for molybdopterin cofactor synthesis required for xanthine dehydrogenase [Geobacillus sp. GHH01]